MEDETGLELSLGLSFGGSSGKSKHKEGGLDLNPEEGNAHKRFMDRDLNVADNSLKQFLQDGIETRALIHMESQISNEPQRGDLGIHQKENFWTDLGNNSSSEVDPSYLQKESSDFSMYSKLWTHMAVPNDEEKEQSRGGLWKEASNKRKVPYEELNHQKKQSREIEHVNINECHASTENEHVAESEVEGSSSKSRHNCSNIHYMSSESERHKSSDKPTFIDSNPIDSQDRKQGCEPIPEIRNMIHGMPFAVQPVGVIPMQYPISVNVPTTSSTSSTSGFPIPPVMKLVSTLNKERLAVQPMTPNNFQLAFGYSPVQPLALETADSYANAHRSIDDGKTPQGAIQSKDNAKSDAHDEVGTSSTYRIGDDVGVTINIFKPKEGSDSQTLDGLAQYGSVIKPGIAPGLKFGGCGSQPDLPWVWTSGQGPNGKPISGVTYKYGINQIRIVCACHGVHMSPDEFIQHAKSDGHNSENNTNSANPQGNGNAPSSDKK